VFEQHGIPAVSIVTEPFRRTCVAMARSRGLAGFRFLDMPHPIANLPQAQLQQYAEAIAPQVVELLLRGQAG
jgi:hypothetical protein